MRSSKTLRLRPDVADGGTFAALSLPQQLEKRDIVAVQQHQAALVAKHVIMDACDE
jgi:hypothetical protein